MSKPRCKRCLIPMPWRRDSDTCGWCRRRAVLYQAERRRLLAAAGRCVDCKQHSGRYRCEACRARVAANVARCRARRKGE